MRGQFDMYGQHVDIINVYVEQFSALQLTCIQPMSPGLGEGEGVLDCLLLAGAEYGLARGSTGSFRLPPVSSSPLELLSRRLPTEPSCK